jgi:hypothetical protein
MSGEEPLKGVALFMLFMKVSIWAPSGLKAERKAWPLGVGERLLHREVKGRI